MTKAEFLEKLEGYKDNLDSIVVATDMACCGLDEIHGITYCKQPVEWKLARIAQEFFVYKGSGKYDYHTGLYAKYEFRGKCGALIFTDNRRNFPYGRVLEGYIKEHDLGEVTDCGTCTNPNHNSRVNTWVWIPNKNFRRWYIRFCQNTAGFNPEDRNEE